MLKMMDGQAIRAKRSRVAAVPDGLGDEVSGEGRDVAREWVGFGDVFFDSAVYGVRGVGDESGELFVEGDGYFTGFGEVSVVECDGLVGGLRGFLTGEGSENVKKVFCVVFV